MVVAYVVVVLAVLSRFVPHMLHISAWGVTALGGGLLFYGSRLGRNTHWSLLAAIAAIAASDWYLTTQIYGFPFHASAYAITWTWYAVVCCMGWMLLHRRRTALRVIGSALASSTGFFLLSNGAVWLSGTMYTKSPAGLFTCYAAGLPFYRNDALSTLAVCGVLFGLPAIARRMAEDVGDVRGRDAAI